MNAAHFGQMVSVEFRKLLSRTLAKVGLGLTALTGLIPPVVIALFLWLFEYWGAPLDAPPGLAAKAPYYALFIRNIFLTPVFLITLSALSIAGEWQTRTLREDLLRPVPRWSILMSKWLALVGWAALSLCLTLVSGAIMSAVIWGFSGNWLGTISAYAFCVATDAAFLALVFLVAVVTRSVPGAILATFVPYSIDIMLQMYLITIGWFPRQLDKFVETAQPWLPSSAFFLWTTLAMWASADPASGVVIAFPTFSLISFGLLLFGCLGLALVAFQKIDVP